MRRDQLEHIIRAAAANADVRDIVVVGSQAILGSYPDAPAELTESMEADVFPKDAPELSNVIDGAIGEMSLFHTTFGYFGHGIDETTAALPNGWKDRLVKIQNPNTMGAVGWCLEPNDLAVSKLVAGREKDADFVRALLRHRMIDPAMVKQRLAATPNLHEAVRQAAEARVDRLAAESNQSEHS